MVSVLMIHLCIKQAAKCYFQCKLGRYVYVCIHVIMYIFENYILKCKR